MTEYLNSVEYYDVDGRGQNEFKAAPALNVGRSGHSSCTFDETVVYTFCGENSTGRLNSIERLKLSSQALKAR